MARKLKMTARRQKQIIDMIELGQTIAYACEAVGIHRNTELRFRKSNPDYEKLVNEALESRAELVADSLFMQALNGDVSAIKFFLINRANDKWKSEQYMKVSGDEKGAPIGIAIKEVLVELTRQPEDSEQKE